jgi:hypothetical protein
MRDAYIFYHYSNEADKRACETPDEEFLQRHKIIVDNNFINCILANLNAGWSSLVARRAHNPKVVGSNPSPATKHIKDLGDFLLSPFLVLLPYCYPSCKKCQHPINARQHITAA